MQQTEVAGLTGNKTHNTWKTSIHEDVDYESIESAR